MSDEIINDALPWISYPYGRDVIGFKATLLESGSGVQQIIPHTSHDRRRFRINLDQFTEAQLDATLDFYLERKGIQDDFLFRDVHSPFVARQQIGVGTGSQTQYQLTDNWGGTSVKRWDIDNLSTGAPADPLFWVAGSPVVGWTLDYTSSGIVTLPSPPSGGQIVEAEYYYLRRVRFAQIWTDDLVDYQLNNIPMVLDEVIVV